MIKNATILLLAVLFNTSASIWPMIQKELAPVRPPNLYIVNKTAWPASVFWTVNGRKFNTVVNAYRSEMLGLLSTIENLEIGTYGEMWGRVFKRHVVSLEKLKQDKNLDGCVIINEKYWGKCWSFTSVAKEMPSTVFTVLPEDVWNAFPGVVRAREMGRQVMPHHIINIDPTNATEEMIYNAYKRLKEQWNPEKFTFDQTAVKICEILYEAHLALQKELVSGAKHTEETVYKLDDHSK